METSSRSLSFAKYAAYGYKFMLVYTAVHTNPKSVMMGMTREDMLPFCTEEACKEWVKAVNAKEAKKPGSVGYKVVLSYVRSLEGLV